MNTRQTLELLRAYESRNVTFMERDGSWPIVWRRARGVHVWDAEGKKYLDLTAAFGVAAAGHANPQVVRAGQKQMAQLLHAMGDVHPHALKAQLARKLSEITFERWNKTSSNRFPLDASARTGKTIFCSSGFEAVEAGLKTAMLATGKPGVIAFEGAYHGLGYGALNATHRSHFRRPFLAQMGAFAEFVPFPRCSSCECPGRPLDYCETLDSLESRIEKLIRRKPIGAILVEPVQARGGIHVPEVEFLNRLAFLRGKYGVLLIVDEIYTGFGRTGAWFACEHSAVVPDIICLGKALAGGFPLSACIGRADLMDRAWPPSLGEAIHTSTFLGHPVGCAMALANIAEIGSRKLVEHSAHLGGVLLEQLLKVKGSKFKVRCSARGLGLMAGVELCNDNEAPATDLSLRVIKKLLHRGYIFLPEGEHANVISLTPPLTISKGQLTSAVNALRDVLAE